MNLVEGFKKRYASVNKRTIKENLTGYLFIAPATLLVLVFGIFPVFFALYMSLHKWRIKQGAFIGINNYVKAIGDIAYLLFFAVGLVAFVGVFIFIKQILAEAKLRNEKPWLFIIPGVLFTATIAAMVRWVVFLLPNFLGIADRLIGQTRTRDLVVGFLRDAFRVDVVWSAMWLFLGLLLISIISFVVTRVIVDAKGENIYIIKFVSAFTALVAGVVIFWFTFGEIEKAYQKALETNTPITLVPSLITIASGLILLFLAFKAWQSASKKPEKKSFWWKLMAAFILMVAGWLLVGEIPQLIASGSEDVWKGLKVTVFFSMFTVPFQLVISLFLSILLFQKLKGSNILRIVYFLPYVTPAIASATVFKQLFSNRESSPVNMFLKGLGMQPQAWLHESHGVIEIIAESFGAVDFPNWLAGPSLALVVIIIHSIWTYVGYNTVIYMAGLSNIPNDLLDAGEVDGASKWELFKHIIFPLLSPTTYFLSLMSIMGTFKAFNTIWMFRESLSLGTVDTFSVTVFLEFYEKLRYGYSTALAFILFAIILSLTYINNRTQGKRVFYG